MLSIINLLISISIPFFCIIRIEQQDHPYFPYKTFKPGQDTIYQEVQDHKSVIIHAPTGMGKTIASLAAILRKRRMDEKVFVFVHTINQMSPILREWKKIIDFQENKITILPYLGRERVCGPNCLEQHRNTKNKNYNSTRIVFENLVESLNDDPTIVMFNEFLTAIRGCKRKVVDSMLEYSDIIVSTYPYLENDLFRKLLKLSKIRIEKSHVLVDEAHNLIKPQYYFGSHEDVQFMILLYPDDKFFRSLHWFRKRGISKVKDEEIRQHHANYACKRLKKLKRNMIDTKYLKLIDNFIGFLEAIGKGYFTYQPNGFFIFDLYPSRYLDKFAQSVSQVYQSATFFYLDKVIKLFGIPEDTKQVNLISHQRKIPSQFRCYIKNTTSLEKNRNKFTYKIMWDNILGIYLASPRHILVLCASYEYIEEIERYIPVEYLQYCLFEHEDTELSDFNEIIFSSRRILLIFANQRGRLKEGIEWVHNGRSLISIVIMAGIATYIPNEDFRVDHFIRELYGKKLGKDLDLFLYDFPTYLIAAQSFGRAIRSENDKAALIVLDFRAEKYLNRALQLSWYPEIKDIMWKVHDFFKSYPTIHHLRYGIYEMD